MASRAPTPLTRNQIRGFWAAWAGWTLDGMDSFIYALVMVPALRELLPHSGIVATSGAIGYYGGLLFAVFLAGWGLSFVWGPIGDRIGRLRALMLTVLCYSAFTFCGALAQNVWWLAAFRLMAGIGIGGEWGLGGVYVAEAWPEDRRSRGAGYMHTGYYFGFFLAAVANYAIGARFGWRAMFLLGGAPAVIVSLIRHGVAEPERWSKTRKRAPLLAPLRDDLLARISRTHGAEFHLSLHFDRRSLGRLGVCPRVGHSARHCIRPLGHAGRAVRFVGRHVARGGHHSRMPRRLASGRKVRPPRRPRALLRPHGGIHLARLRLRVLPARPRLTLVHGLPVRAGSRRREFRNLYFMAAGAISHRLPRQRVCVYYIAWDASPPLA